MMDSPARPCRDARRQAILETASDVFLEEGFAAASMSAIAARLGGSKGTLYNYFDSKESLFSAVIQDHCDRGQAEVFDFDIQAADVGVALRTVGERYLRLMLSDDVVALNRLVIAEAVRFPQIGRTLYEAGLKRGLKRIAAYIQTAMDDGRLRPADPELAAEQMMELCLAGAYRLRLLNVAPKPDAAEVRAKIETALAAFMQIYGAADAPAGPSADNLLDPD
jgi:AcrR family transcriptional regulator